MFRRKIDRFIISNSQRDRTNRSDFTNNGLKSDHSFHKGNTEDILDFFHKEEEGYVDTFDGLPLGDLTRAKILLNIENFEKETLVCARCGCRMFIPNYVCEYCNTSYMKGQALSLLKRKSRPLGVSLDDFNLPTE